MMKQGAFCRKTQIFVKISGCDFTPREFKGKETIIFPTEFICLDVETTGLNPKYDRIIEIAAIHVRDGYILGTFSSLVALSGGRHLSEDVRELTGITEEMLHDAPEAAEVMPKFFAFVGDHILVGHNVRFDINFIFVACERCGLRLQNNYFDTLNAARKKLPFLKHHALCDVADYLQVEQTTAHRAEADAITTAKCLIRLRRLGQRIANPDEYWAMRMQEAVTLAKRYVKHTWELTGDETG